VIFLYDENASNDRLVIKGENFKYLIKVRRHKVNDELCFRNQKTPEMLYRYKISSIESKKIVCDLIEQNKSIVEAGKKLHVGWCIIDVKSVERVLATLNEIGVDKISFIYCKRSQRNFKMDLKRFERILLSSNQQCGRSTLMEFEILDTLESFLDKYDDVKVFDFCDNILGADADFKKVLIGCEGGFDEDERKLLANYENFRLNTKMVLRSQSAVVAVASKIVLG